MAIKILSGPMALLLFRSELSFRSVLPFRAVLSFRSVLSFRAVLPFRAIVKPIVSGYLSIICYN